MFTFDTPTAVKLGHVNLRAEKRGEQSAPAIDVKFVRQAGNDALAMLHPGLKDALYFRDEQTEAQGQIDGVPEIAPNLRFPKLGSLAWDLEMSGCRVVIDYGLGDELSNIVLADCKVNQFRVECMEGGTVEITFRVQTSNFPSGALDKLAGKLDQETKITIDGPSGQPAQEPLPESKPKGRAKTAQMTPEQALAASVH